MTTTDYLIDSALVLLVLLQIKERPMTRRQLIRPLIILGVAVASYLHGIPTQGNDLPLLGVFAVIGGAIGLASGLTVLMHIRSDGVVTFHSGWASGFFWVLGMGSRFAFVYWISHGGMHTIANFSGNHQITSTEAWTVALLGMAVFEVLGRTVTMALRWREMGDRTAAALVA
jgi:hypothetical protein